MEWYEIAVDGGRSLKFPTRGLQPATSGTQREKKHLQQHNVAVGAADADSVAASPQLGGIINRGAWGWLTSGGNALEVTALRTGQTIATYEFTEALGYDNCCIRCVEELFPLQNTDDVLLAVCLECFRAAGGGCTFIAIYSIERGHVLSCMELPIHVTSTAFVSGNCCRRSLLQNFDGCLAVGSEEGIILLMDLNVNKILETFEERLGTSLAQATDRITPSQIADYNLPLADIHRRFRQTRQDGLHFGLQVEVIDIPCSVQCLLPIDLALGLAIGLEDGRLAFYDLAELQIIHISTPQQPQAMAPVVKLSYLEPLDDPRHCLYVWAMHENGENLSAVLHTLIYEKRLLTENDDFYYFESFLRSSIRLQIPLEATKSVAIGCQSVNKIQNNNFNNSSLNGMMLNNTTHDDEDGYCLCALTWYSALEEKNKLLIFDLNQWYKEEMPYSISQQKCPSYLAGYVLSGRQCALSAYLNPNTVSHFNSLQRYEEHFYPNSLSFDFLLLLEQGTLGYTWIGAQNKIINVLRASNSSIFLEPDMYFREILRTRLLPQFSELNVDSTFSRLSIFETILSVSLEHSCFSLLRDCAKCWADGSFVGSNLNSTTGVSLSTLTDWIWKRATDIKTRSNDLSKGLFDYNGYPLDKREQKELCFLTRQLKLLGDLLSEVLSIGKRYIPDKIYVNLETQHKSIRMASEYQDVLLWLLNIGLLPEMQRKRNTYSPYNLHAKSPAIKVVTSNIIQYPYSNLKDLNERKRKFFASINDSFISKKTGSCRLLFIDALIAHECKGDSLRECWLENGGNGLYPPPSIEAMLRVMLVPEMEFESKCAILLYFFLDLHMTIDEQAHKEIVESFVKFPSVFKLTATLIKTVQSLWNLDHGLFMPAVDEFISPFNNNRSYPQWMVELLIESLLTQNAANYALRILEARPTLIAPILKLNTLLANDLISEAFHFARTKQDDKLLECFFNICLCAGKYGVIRDLALTEREGELVQRILRNSKTHGAENLHFVYLLQKSKYIEAVSYLDELSRAKSMRGHYGAHENSSGVVGNTDTPNLVLSAFNTTMAPVTQGLTDVYFRIKNKIKRKEADNHSPLPLSCQLIKQNANNLLGGIYHSSALSAHFATYYWGEMDLNGERGSGSNAANSLLSANNAPFLRKPQAETCNFQRAQFAPTDVSYPQPYRATEKRTLVESELEQDDMEAAETPPIAQNIIPQPRKRRRLLGQEIVENLGHFIQNNKSASQLTAQGFDLQPPAAQEEQEPKEKSTKNKTTVATAVHLAQPLTTSRRQVLASYDGSRVNRSPGARAMSELHSILKTSNTPDRNERAQSLRRDLHTMLEENKNLRFKLPATEITEESSNTTTNKCENLQKLQTLETQPIISRRRIVTTTTSVDENEEDFAVTSKLVAVTVEVPKELKQDDEEIAEDEIVDEVVIEVHHEDPISKFAAQSCIKDHRQQQVNEKSEKIDNKNKAHSEQEDQEEEEEENFYSPLSSRNNSLIAADVPSPSAPQPIKTFSPSAVVQTTSAKIFRLSGPQPRKPLARLSAERSQSRTPEIELLTQLREDEDKHEESQHQIPPQSNLKNQTSSGYVSVTSSTAVNTSKSTVVDKPILEIKSVVSLASRDFTPRSSSSKLYPTQSKLSFDETKMPATRAKLSECSTMVGSFCIEEECMLADGTDETDKMANDTKSYALLQSINEFAEPHTAEAVQQQPMTDTTLGMSSYEFTLPHIKSHVTMQATTIEAGNTKQKAAMLKSMDTVEVMDMAEEVEVENEGDVDEDEQFVYGTEAETDLCITTQQTVYGDEDADVEDSNDMMAFYKSRRAEIVERNEQVSANESNDSSVIILSSSTSSDHMSANNEAFDSDVDADDVDDYVPGPVDHGDEDDDDDDDEDEYEGEYEDDGESTDEVEEDDENWDDDRDENHDSSSPVEVVNEANSSEKNSATSKSTEGQEENPCETDEKGKNTDEEGEYTKQNSNTENNSFDPQSETNDSSQSVHDGSVEIESRIVVEEATSNCNDYKELVMSETVEFVKSKDEQHADAEEKSFYSSRGVCMQNESEIISQELKVSAYKANSKNVYEELSGDVFHCDAEGSSESLKDTTKRELEIDAEPASTSTKANELNNTFSAKLDVEEASINEDFEQSDSERIPLMASASIVAHTSDAAKTEKDAPSSSTSTKAEEIVEDKKTEQHVQKAAEKAEDIVPEKLRKPTPNNSEKEPEDEDPIKLHVNEAGLSEIEDPINSSIKIVAGTKAEESVQMEILEVAQMSIECVKSLPNERENETTEAGKESATQETTDALISKQKGLPQSPTSAKPHMSLRSKVNEKEAETLVSTPTRMRSNLRGTSVPAAVNTQSIQTPVDEVCTPMQRNKRCISMPPQTRAQQEHEATVLTSESRVSSRRSLRGGSAHPSEEIGTPRTRRSIRGLSMPHELDENIASTTTTPVRAGRGTSVPPNTVAAAKIVTRRRSALLDAINESVPIVDSPSARTRSRMRLNSGDSELDSSIVSSSEQAQQTKRPRRSSSVASSVVSEQPTTPSGRRTRNSMNSATSELNSEVGGTPRSMRRITRRRESIDTMQQSADEQDDEQAAEQSKEFEKKPKTETASSESAVYSAARRLTRTQLAIMEKSAALSKNLNISALHNTAAAIVTSPSAKRISKRRTSRSTVHDSDDAESVSSRMSNVSGAPRVRRVTRSSVKDKEENDDDLLSIASSVGSERSLLKRRSKESKDSPNTALTTIQEDEAEDPNQNKGSRSTRKRLS
ncbi:protein ELYS homolog [Eurosta solidaginis]|uniref:protein ELYS homolog n=1 Tax=Eurosta solidaginis TaxID=178769 RepID=UPI003530EE08